ncbi:MAG: hypothetical protein Q8Q48_01915, partial [Candidatus Staskawiczbacteria bacterium]|nr:hypothetical protein [Candidatus Staskawiczbacteria bacterium]
RGVEEQKDDNKNQIEVPSKVIPGKTAIVQTDRMAGLQKDDVKINRIKLPPKLEAMAKARASGGPVEQSQGSGSKIEDNFFEKPAVIKDSIISKAKPKTQSNNDASIFGGKEELSRSDLRQELRNDSKVWKAQREAGLNLSPVERTKLEKQVFSQTYGGNISKSDFRAGIKKLNQKLIGVKNQTEHAKIRKEIKFLKKIGGIK